MLRHQALADALRDDSRIENEFRVKTPDEMMGSGQDVFVTFQPDDDRDWPHHLDVVLGIAHDHGYVPAGITETPSLRLVQRTSGEATRILDR